MATVSLKEAEVMRLIPGYGASVAESFKTRDGETKKAYFTVWTLEQLAEGDIINVRGQLSVKLDEYETAAGMQHRASASINNPTIEKVDVSF